MLLEAVEEAAYEPGSFSPLCEFDATYVLGQSQGQAGMGWYNVPASDTAAIPFSDGTALNTSGLNVLITPQTVLGATILEEDIRNDPAYLGGRDDLVVTAVRTVCVATVWPA